MGIELELELELARDWITRLDLKPRVPRIASKGTLYSTDAFFARIAFARSMSLTFSWGLSARTCCMADSR